MNAVYNISLKSSGFNKIPQNAVINQLCNESESESHVRLRDPRELYSPWNSPGQNTGVGSLFLLQSIFPTQVLNPVLLHWRGILYQSSHKGRPKILEWVAYPFSSGLPHPGIKMVSPALQEDSLPTEQSGKPTYKVIQSIIISYLLCLLNLNFPVSENSFDYILSQVFPIKRAKNLFSSCSHKIWYQCWFFFPYTWKIDLSHMWYHVVFVFFWLT